MVYVLFFLGFCCLLQYIHIYKTYIIRYGNGPRQGSKDTYMSIGICGKNYDKSVVYIGGCSNSYSLDILDHDNSRLVHNDFIEATLTGLKLGKGGVKNQLSENENEDAMYFMIEVNLLTNSVEFVGNAFEKVDNNSLFAIGHITKPYRIGLSIFGVQHPTPLVLEL